MSFQLVPNAVTLNDLEWRNSSNLCIISPNSIAFWTHYVKVVEDSPTFCSRNVAQIKNLVLALYHLWRYWQAITPSEQSRLNVLGGPGPARLMGPLLSLWPTWRGWGRSTLYQRIQ